MLSALVVINPKAGTKQKKNLENLILNSIKSKYTVEFLYWELAEENIIEKIIKQINYKLYDIVIACGGDGTINRVGQALINRKEKLAIIPLGSGNGLARHLQISMNIKKALKLVIKGKVAEIDAVRINNNYYFCTSGVGYDANVAHLFANAGKRGIFTYIRMVLVSFFSYKPERYIIKCNENEFIIEAFFITVANANQWGNNVVVAPLADISDGLLDIVVLKSFKWYNIPSMFYRLMTKSFHLSKKVLYNKCTAVFIKKEAVEIKGHFDGEPVVFQAEIAYNVENKVLKVLVP